MCGICGYIGNGIAFNYIYDGICSLLNRGYDSVGICTLNSNSILRSDISNLEITKSNNNFLIHKYASTDIERAEKKILKHKEEHINSQNNIGIGHCRWRTTGNKNDINAHPHIDMYNKFSLVHNGIIENYKELKDFLINEGFVFKSETDTEIIVNLISYFYKNNTNIIHSINKAINHLEGTYALAILCIDSPNSLYCVRKGSPLLIGFSEDYSYSMVASEKYGFEQNIKNYMCLENNDIVIIERNYEKCSFKSYSGIAYNINNLEILINSNTCHPYETWTLKEIYEQKDTYLRAIGNGGRIKDDYNVKLGGLEQNESQLLELENIILLGCGSSLNAAYMSEKFFREICNFNTVQVIDASLFSKHYLPKKGKTGIILISQSGETYELSLCINIAKQENITMIGVVNVVDSLIARETLCGVYLNSCREISVCSTKAVSSQIIVLSLIALWFSQNQNRFDTVYRDKRKKYISDLKKLNLQIEHLLNKMESSLFNYNELLNVFKDKNECFVISQSLGIALEGALKLKEMCYIMAEGDLASSLKHGPFSILNNKFPVILIDNNDENHNKVNSIYNEIISREGNVITITNNYSSWKNRNNCIETPYNETYANLLSLISMQLFIYHLSKGRNQNVDYPRNLAKTITV
jgi:glucosamine--fructose-6-phosphate aminotransferase (isomerizing)